ncbi:hypothetical protein [Fodinicola acaciae]|uniref:hypothetical protein n=1 Tax=Fodinicola acaciae TaxID=2681555 RepID=UPI0013D014E9|nr:hypothetical protein [Fodinicola acaciae]
MAFATSSTTSSRTTGQGGESGQTHAGGAARPIAMYVGLALTVLATVAPLLDLATVDTLTSHVRDAYPQWAPHLVAIDRNAIAIYLVASNALGVPVWLMAIHAVRKGKRWAPIAATAGLVAGLLFPLIDFSLKGGAYDIVVPYGYGALTLVPCVAGLIATIATWRNRRPAATGSRMDSRQTRA